MPKLEISTYSSLEVQTGGTLIRVPVTNIVCEDAIVANISKEVNVFDKYASKKNISARCKSADIEVVR